MEMKRPVFWALGLCFLALPLQAGPIESACLASPRAGGSSALCGCIQQVADATLTSSDQRRAARFFADPEEAQKVKQSGTNAAEAFWRRYADFGAAAEMVCAG
jgi:hypothetical protein